MRQFPYPLRDVFVDVRIGRIRSGGEGVVNLEPGESPSTD